MIQTKTSTANNAIFKCRENYQFFKAVYYNCRHYLCDFSSMTKAGKDCYLVDIEISGKGFLNIEMQQSGNIWEMINNTDIVDTALEMILSNAIINHVDQYHA